jgi:hypothetical protein
MTNAMTAMLPMSTIRILASEPLSLAREASVS